MTIRGPIPEHVRRLMQPEVRQELDAPIQAEADERFIARAEKQLQNNIAALLTERNITFFRQRMDRRTTGLKGQPDFLFAVNGRACAVECKTMDGKLTQEQKNVLIDLQADGWRTWICRSEMDFLTWLKTVEAADA